MQSYNYAVIQINYHINNTFTQSHLHTVTQSHVKYTLYDIIIIYFEI